MSQLSRGLTPVNATGDHSSVCLHRIRCINTFEVLESDFELLGNTLAAEQRTSGYALFSLGAIISLLASWLGASSLTPFATACFVAVLVSVSLTGSFFAITWHRCYVTRTELLARIRRDSVQRSGRKSR